MATTREGVSRLSSNGYWSVQFDLDETPIVVRSQAVTSFEEGASDYARLLASKRAAEQRQKLCRLFVAHRRSTHKRALRAVVQATQRLEAAQVSPEHLAVLLSPGSGKSAMLVELYFALERRASGGLFSIGQQQALNEWLDAALRAVFAGVEESTLRSLVYAAWRSAAIRANLDDKRGSSSGSAVLQELAHSISRHAPPDSLTQGPEWPRGETDVITTLAPDFRLGCPARPCPWVGRRAGNGRRIDLQTAHHDQGDFRQARPISRKAVVGVATGTRPKTCGRGHGELRPTRSCRHSQCRSRRAGARKEMAHAGAETHSWRDARATASVSRDHEGQDVLGRPRVPKDEPSHFLRPDRGSRDCAGTMGWAREWR